MAISQHDKAVQFKALHQGPRAFVIMSRSEADRRVGRPRKNFPIGKFSNPCSTGQRPARR